MGFRAISQKNTVRFGDRNEPGLRKPRALCWRVRPHDRYCADTLRHLYSCTQPREWLIPPGFADTFVFIHGIFGLSEKSAVTCTGNRTQIMSYDITLYYDHKAYRMTESIHPVGKRIHALLHCEHMATRLEDGHIRQADFLFSVSDTLGQSEPQRQSGQSQGPRPQQSQSPAICEGRDGWLHRNRPGC